MLKILISAFNSPYVDYAEAMYRSFSKFNPKIKMYCCDCGLTEKDIQKIQSLNVIILKSDSYLTIKDGRHFDMILEDFLIDTDWDKLMWADADTLFLKNVEHLFNMNYDFIGHPGRNEHGLVLKSKDKTYPKEVEKLSPDGNYYATGMWVSGNKQLIKDFNTWIKNNPEYKGSDCPPMTEIVNNGYTSYQLDGNLYNFSRDIVASGKLKNNFIYYKIKNQKFYPYTIGFSTCSDGKRLTSDGIEKFYKQVICG